MKNSRSALPLTASVVLSIVARSERSPGAERSAKPALTAAPNATATPQANGEASPQHAVVSVPAAPTAGHPNAFTLPDPSQSPAAKKSAGGTPATFIVEGKKVAANVYFPPDYDPKKKYQTVVVVTPQGGLKEQTAGIYALKLSKQGYVTIAFDHRSYGQSGGEPRHVESPQWKTEDIKGAVSFMGTVPGVDAEKIGVLAICSGAGYGVMASVRDYRVKALATVSGVFDFRERESGIDGVKKPTEAQVKRFREKMKTSAHARQRYFQTGVMEYTPLVPDLGPDTSDFWKQGYEYYRTERGFINGWENKRSADSMEARLSVNTSLMLPGLADLGTPFLAIAGDKAFTYPFSVTAVERATGEKELFTIPGATHFDLYDQPGFVDQAVKKLAAFFGGALSGLEVPANSADKSR